MSNEMKAGGRVNGIEKRVILTAILFSCFGIGMVAYAAYGMGISTPECVPNSRIFEHGSVEKHGEKNYEVHFLAAMWAFEPTKIVVPVGSTLDLFVISKDVTHGFNVLGTNVNLMVEPAVVNEGKVHFDHAGVYPIVCHEYCGVGHQAMNASIEVSESATDITAEGLPISEGAAAVAGAAPFSAMPGHAVLDQKGCLACHSLDGTANIGPTFKGLWGSKVTLTDGTTATVNEEYVEEMIESPGKRVVKGFNPIMPKLPVSEREMKEIIDYLKVLK